MKLACCLLLVFIFSAQTHPDNRTRLAIFDLRPVGVSATAAQTVSGLIRRDMQRIILFRIIEPSRMKALLMEKVFHPLECSDSECAMRAGKILQADKVAVGEIGTLGNNFVITVRIIDTGKGLTEYSARAVAPSVAGIEPAARRIVAQLNHQMAGTGEGRDGVGDTSRLMYLCGNFARRGDVISLEKNRGMAASTGARARVRGVMMQHESLYIDIIWIDEKAKSQGNGGYLAENFKLVSRGEDTGDAPR